MMTITALPAMSQRAHLPAPLWKNVRRLITGTEPLTYEQARTHLELAQCDACVVREGARGPRGGRGKMHYNGKPEWPTEWRPNKFDRYWAVVGEDTP